MSEVSPAQNERGRLWVEHRGEGPLMATAIHAGHEVRLELLPLLAIDAVTRSREEDAYTDYWAKVVPTWLVPTRSRFEVDLNRTRDNAVYVAPEMAWDLDVWQAPPDQEIVDRSRDEHDRFYGELGRILDRLVERHGHVVILDLHSYNFRREGPEQPPADADANPEVNVGTGSLDRALFGSLVDRFVDDLREYDFLGRRLDVRENVKFRGRHLARWIHEHYAGAACVLSIEFKKFYMDEWTGVGDVEQIQEIRAALAATLPGLLEELGALEREHDRAE